MTENKDIGSQRGDYKKRILMKQYECQKPLLAKEGVKSGNLFYERDNKTRGKQYEKKHSIFGISINDGAVYQCFLGHRRRGKRNDRIYLDRNHSAIG